MPGTVSGKYAMTFEGILNVNYLDICLKNTRSTKPPDYIRMLEPADIDIMFRCGREDLSAL